MTKSYTLSILAAVSITLTGCLTAPAQDTSCQKCFAEASQVLADGDAVKAYELMQKLSSQCNNNQQFQILFATVLLRLSNHQAAEKAALRAIELNPKSTAAHFQYALTLKALGKRESAVAEFDKVVELDPGNWESFASLSDLYKEMHQDDKAKQCEYKAATLAAPTLSARNSFFQNLIQQGKLAKAEEEFNKYINTNAENPVVLGQLAKQALLYNFWGPAMTASDLVLKSYPDSQETLLSKATGQYFQHKYQDCQNTVSAILKLAPENTEAKVLSALCLLDLGQITEAAEVLESAGAPKDNLPLSQLAVAKWHQARGDLKAAESTFGSISDEIVLPEAQIALSHLCGKQGRLDEALVRATFNATSQSTLSRMLASQAEAIYQEGGFASEDKSKELVTKALAINANEPLALLAMSKLELSKGNATESRLLANKVIQTVPGCSEAYLIIGKIELAEGKTAEAEKQLDKVLSLSNDDPDASLILGKIYLEAGNRVKALDSLKAALAGRQESAEICYVLAKALEQDGQRTQSLKYYKQSLSLGLAGAENTEATQAIKRLSSNE